MARTWVDKRAPIEWNKEQVHYEKRDDLAKALVALMQENPSSDEEYVEALQAARREVNRPFQSEAMLGFQAGRQRLGSRFVGGFGSRRQPWGHRGAGEPLGRCR